MNVIIFCHSILSDWNHGNAHFLRGVAAELVSRGHSVRFYEDQKAWSLVNLVESHGVWPLEEMRTRYPRFGIVRYDSRILDLDLALDGADLVIVHEWNRHALVRQIGEHRFRNGTYRLLFHDTHHRSVTDPDAMASYDLRHYDGVLVFGEAIRSVYLDRGWSDFVRVWHEAADVRLFRPIRNRTKGGDLVWIGNWGDEERTEELRRYLLEPVRELGLRASVYGVRYPEEALKQLEAAAICYAGWLPNYRVPEIMSRFRVTVHIPRRPYVLALPGIPTIRVFEALACGIPLVSSWWEDSEKLFRPGEDFLMATSGREMKDHLRAVLNEKSLAAGLAAAGLKTILSRHTCGHRVEELLGIYHEIKGDSASGSERRSVRMGTLCVRE